MQTNQPYLEILKQVEEKNPLIHNITNDVTVNDCANAILAVGASPIMAVAPEEVAEIVALSSALVINIGTLDHTIIEAMILAGRAANTLNIPVIIDPVGIGASKLRNQTIQKILKEVHVQVIRGNLSEIAYLAGESAHTKGVDVGEADADYDAITIAQSVAKKYHCVVGITGAVDVVSDGQRFAQIYNGHPLLSKVTGTGCMTASLIGSFSSSATDAYQATVLGIAAMGIAGEVAYESAGKVGTGTFHMHILDNLSMIQEKSLLERLKLDENNH